MVRTSRRKVWFVASRVSSSFAGSYHMAMLLRRCDAAACWVDLRLSGLWKMHSNAFGKELGDSETIVVYIPCNP